MDERQRGNPAAVAIVFLLSCLSGCTWLAFAWLVGWLVAWLVDCLIGSLVGWLVGWLVVMLVVGGLAC